MAHVPAPDEAEDLLRASSLFAPLGENDLAALAEEVRWVRLAAGETLFSVGDPADSVFALVSGRLAVVLEAQGETAVAEIAAGQPVGELGLLRTAPRNATVRAMRDSLLAELSEAAFDDLVRSHPDMALGLLRVLASRLDAPSGPAQVRAIAVTTTGGMPPTFAEELATGLGGRLVRAEDLGDDPVRQLGSLVDSAERAAEIVVLDATSGPTGWADGCARQCDRLLIGVDGAARPGRDDVFPVTSVPTELVVFHRGDAAPQGTAAWLERTAAQNHHHLRIGSADDFSRLVRHLTGRTVALVLSGGGSRAFAHIGVARALGEAGVPIDLVAGSSLGAIVGAQLASGLSPEEVLDLNDEVWNRVRPQLRLAVPLISLIQPRVSERLCGELFGDRRLEDAWVPCLVTTVDLDACRLVVHSRGPTATLALASASPPVLWAPVVYEGALLVDGGVLDNLPVDAARQAGAERVVAVNVTRNTSLDTGEVRVVPTTLGLIASRLLQRTNRFPSALALLMRSLMLTSLRNQAAAYADCDVVIEPAVDGRGLTEYSSIREIERLGYEAARRALDAASPDVATWA